MARRHAGAFAQLSMDTPICEAQRHYGQAIPATDRYSKPDTGTWYYCRSCSEQFGSNFKKLGFEWSLICSDMSKDGSHNQEVAE